jgi:hypothetical protein
MNQWCSMATERFGRPFHPSAKGLRLVGGAVEGVPDLGVLGRPGYVTWAGLMGHEDTR